jgi:hypothetical protein
MYNLHLVIGPVQVGLETDEKLSFDGVESLLNRGTLTALTLFNGHMGAMVKYENYDNEEDHDCEECSIENNINNNEEI